MKQSQRFLSLWITVSSLAAVVSAEIITNSNILRRYPSCGLLTANGSRKIYCYAGVIKTDVETYDWDSTLMRLDITDFNTTAKNAWENITSAAGNNEIASQGRERSFTAVSVDGSSLFIHGGLTANKLTNQTIIYGATDNSWSAGYTSSDYSNTNQMYQGSAVDINGKYYLYGGEETFANTNITQYTDPYTNETFTGFFLDDDYYNYTTIGYYQMATYTESIIGANAWETVRPQGNFMRGLIGSAHAAVYHPRTTTIFYFGGYVRDLYKLSLSTASLSQVVTFNTSTMFWGTQNFTSAPPGRMSHSATLLPSNEHVLMYGGATGEIEKAMNDFCYVADLRNYTWVPQFANLKLPNNTKTPASRLAHSAVLDAVTNRLFIVFGHYDSTLWPQDVPLLALNVTDPSALSFIDLTQESVVTTDPSNNGTIVKDGNKADDNNNSATIGGAVGGSIGGVLVIGLVAFFLFKRKKSNTDNQEKASQGPEDHEERLSVDWDAIEGGFVETNLPLTNNTNMVPFTGTNNNNSNVVLENSTLYSSANEFAYGEKSSTVDYNSNSPYEVASQTATSVTNVSPPLMSLSTNSSPLNSVARPSYPPDVSQNHGGNNMTNFITKPDGA